MKDIRYLKKLASEMSRFVWRLTLLKHNPETYLDKFQAWLEYQTGKLYAKQTVSRTIRQVGLSVIKM